MVREDILGGLKTALQRGESLKQAMLTFFNAGYTKEEIEEAARALETGKISPAQQTPPALFVPQEVASRTGRTAAPSIQKVSGYGEKPAKVMPVIQKPVVMTPQKVSGYGEVEKPKGKAVIFILIALLLILLGILAALFFFKDEILSLFGAG